MISMRLHNFWRPFGLPLFSIVIAAALLGGCASAVRYSSRPANQPQETKSAGNTPKQQTPPRTAGYPAAIPFSTTPAALSKFQQALLDKARQYLGAGYCYGGNGPECLDCSGFVSQVFGSCGFVLPRTAQQQSFVGREVGPAEAAVGDLIFFSFGGKAIDHVGMYAGNGAFIHASKSKGVVQQPLESSGMLSAMRVIRRVAETM